MNDVAVLAPPTGMTGTEIMIGEIRQDKYMYVRLDGTTDEKTWHDTLKRICRGVFPDSRALQRRLLGFLEKKMVVPAGRIMSGAGTDKLVTWINCFVCNTILDSMRSEEGRGIGIMDSLSNVAYSMQMGGGVGQDFSPIRPYGAEVKRVGSFASGVIYFADMWQGMCGTIMSAGSRRGAMMLTLDCDHPDLWREDQFETDPKTGKLLHPTFISAKREPGRLTYFNMSILVSDALIEAIEKDEMWALGHEIPPLKKAEILETREKNGKPWYVYTLVPARKLWSDIMHSTYKYAEPGIIFIDRINQWNNLWYCEMIRCTNPCGEQPLPPNGDCNLSAINLAEFVNHPFEAMCDWIYDHLIEAVKITVRMLDSVIDLSPFPLEAQKEEAAAKRRIGLGITGLGDALMMLRARYGSKRAVEFTGKAMREICYAAYRESIQLAKEKGSFPMFDREKFLQGKFIQTLPDDIQQGIKEHGIRNAVLLTIAPTGTSSIAQSNNGSAGVEPPFYFRYDRKVLQPDGSYKEFAVEDYGFTKWAEFAHKGDGAAALKEYRDGKAPDFIVTIDDLTPQDHLEIQAECQRYIDASISKTINCPEDLSFEKFEQTYWDAWKMGCKGCTTYRPDPDSGRGSVLSETKELTTLVEALPKRGEKLSGETYYLKWESLPYPMFVTINNKENQAGHLRPYELFLNSKSNENMQWRAAFTRLVSSIFRRGGDLTFLIEELNQVVAAEGGFWIEGKYVPSEVAYIGQTIERHMRDLGMLPPADGEAPAVVIEKVAQARPIGKECPKCGAFTYIREEGCSKCLTCNHNSCG